MPSPGRRRQVLLTPAAERDITEALIWSEEKFGTRAALRYGSILKQGLQDIGSDPLRPGSLARPELGLEVRSYHLHFSRNRARIGVGIVRSPRHFVLYRLREPGMLDVLRILHDARDLERHIPEE